VGFKLILLRRGVSPETNYPKMNAALEQAMLNAKMNRKTELKQPEPEEDKAARLARHNEAEARRRRKLNDTFQVLKELCGCTKRQQSAILHAAIDTIKELHELATRLQIERKVLVENVNPGLSLLEGAASHHNGTATASFFDSSASRKRARPEDGLIEMSAGAIKLETNGVRLDHAHNFKNSDIARVIYSPSGGFLDWNRAFSDMMQYTDDFLSESTNTVFSITHPDSLVDTFMLLSKLLKQDMMVGQHRKKFLGGEGQVVEANEVMWLVREPNGDASSVNMILFPVEEPGQVESVSSGSDVAAVENTEAKDSGFAK